MTHRTKGVPTALPVQISRRLGTKRVVTVNLNGDPVLSRNALLRLLHEIARIGSLKRHGGHCSAIWCGSSSGDDVVTKDAALDHESPTADTVPVASGDANDLRVASSPDAGEEEIASDALANSNGDTLGEVGATCTLLDASNSYPFYCYQGSGGACSDVGYPPVCTDGKWVCGANRDLSPMLRSDECKCSITPTPPGQACSCSNAGWKCGPTSGGLDAPADAQADAEVDSSADAGLDRSGVPDAVAEAGNAG